MTRDEVWVRMYCGAMAVLADVDLECGAVYFSGAADAGLVEFDSRFGNDKLGCYNVDAIANLFVDGEMFGEFIDGHHSGSSVGFKSP
jgi:hypothetical protein